MVELLAVTHDNLTMSMLTDRQANRALEWDIRNAVVMRKARTPGIATPINGVVVPLLAAAGGPGSTPSVRPPCVVTSAPNREARFTARRAGSTAAR
jgi:hypothetical protein